MTKSSKVAENFTIEKMEKQGLLIHEKHEATLAFQVEEFEDEGTQHFIELKNGSVLFLCGQYLYDYEPMEGARKQSRSAPSLSEVTSAAETADHPQLSEQPP